MERLRDRLETVTKALESLGKVIEELKKNPEHEITRDAQIKRFEYSFDTFWKYIREILKHRHGITENSPKSVFRAAHKVGLLAAEETEQCLDMVDTRNETTHTYDEETAIACSNRIPGYFVLMNTAVIRTRQEIQ